MIKVYAKWIVRFQDFVIFWDSGGIYKLCKIFLEKLEYCGYQKSPIWREFYPKNLKTKNLRNHYKNSSDKKWNYSKKIAQKYSKKRAKILLCKRACSILSI